MKKNSQFKPLILAYAPHICNKYKKKEEKWWRLLLLLYICASIK